jgi:hypothetical protein
MKNFHYAEVEVGILSPLSSLEIASVTLTNGKVVKVETHMVNLSLPVDQQVKRKPTLAEMVKS